MAVVVYNSIVFDWSVHMCAWDATGNCAIFATKEVVSVTCTPTKGYTLAVLRHLFGGISLVNVINRFSVCIAKIPQSPV